MAAFNRSRSSSNSAIIRAVSFLEILAGSRGISAYLVPARAVYCKGKEDKNEETFIGNVGAGSSDGISAD
jgi:hypothetical protein